MKVLENTTQAAGFPFLLKSGQVQSYLGVSQSSLHRLWDEIDTLVLPGNTRRYPLPYMLGLKYALESGDSTKHLATARTFATTSMAEWMIQEEHAHLGNLLDTATENEFVAAQNIARILNIGRPVLNDWEIRQNAEFVRRGSQVYMRRDELDAVCTWQLPAILQLDQSPTQ